MIILKTIEQVSITESFITNVRTLFAQKLERLDGRHINSSEQYIRSILDFWLTEKGFQAFLTRMKQLPYAEFNCIHSRDTNWFKATTHPLIVDVGRRQNHSRDSLPPGKYDIGAYSIYTPFSSMLTGNIDSTHFIPHKRLTGEYDREMGRDTHVRHLHHYAYLNRGSMKNPLSYQVRTCWGNMGGLVSGNMSSLDLPELYRTLYLFVTIQNVDSPLVYFRELDHYERIGNE